MTEVLALEGRSFGPHPLRFCLEKVRDFNAATGTDPARWVEAAPPAFLASALFVVAPDLLEQLDGYAVIHGDQSFSWNGPLGMERDVKVSGTVSKVRERGDTFFVTFDLEVKDGDGGVLATGSSLFLVSESKPTSGAGDERQPPPAEDRGACSGSQRSASRADLVRYAAATRDWNPIHWDHRSATEAGLDGVIAHGLLQASWALDSAAQETSGLRPFASAKVRFRNQLPPATPIDVNVDGDDRTLEVTLSRGETVYLTARVEVADE